MRENALNILGINIAPLTIQSVNELVDKSIKSNVKGYITVTGVHGIIESLFNPSVKKAHLSALHCLPDGMPLVWIGRSRGHKRINRCYGPDIFWAVMQNSVNNGIKHFLYGGDTGVAQELKMKMEEEFPGLRIVGTYTPPFRDLYPDEEKELFEIVRSTQPDIIWMGLSTPKQELFMYNYLPKLDTKIMIGVGAAFDFHVGRVKQAPRLIQKVGLEWLFRLLVEPKRLWRRYFKIVPLFIFLYTLQALGIKKY